MDPIKGADALIELKDAIEISRIIAKAPEERLAMIISIFEEAELSISGLEDLEAWAVSRDGGMIIEANEFMGAIKEKFHPSVNGCNIPASDFTKFCSEMGFDARAIKKWLAKRGAIQVEDSNGKTAYTKVVKIDGKNVRCISFVPEWVSEHDKEKV